MPELTIRQVASMGGAARAKSLTKTRRLEIAKKASKAAQIARLKKSVDLASKVAKT